MKTFIQIKSAKFPPLPGEVEKLVNAGMFCKALALYLQQKLQGRGYDAPFICCEDWGWWIELKTAPFAFGVCIYALPGADPVRQFVCTDGATGPVKWSWKRFRFVETFPWAKALQEDLMQIFQADADVQIVGLTDDFPSVMVDPLP